MCEAQNLRQVATIVRKRTMLSWSEGEGVEAEVAAMAQCRALPFFGLIDVARARDQAQS